jgi:hypothetical protein
VIGYMSLDFVFVSEMSRLEVLLMNIPAYSNASTYTLAVR